MLSAASLSTTYFLVAENVFVVWLQSVRSRNHLAPTPVPTKSQVHPSNEDTRKKKGMGFMPPSLIKPTLDSVSFDTSDRRKYIESTEFQMDQVMDQIEEKGFIPAEFVESETDGTLLYVSLRKDQQNYKELVDAQ